MKDFAEIKDAERKARISRRKEVGAMLESGIVFRTIRDDTYSQLGGGLIVAERKSGGFLEVAFAFCHKTEQFNKVEGKFIAGSRLLEGKGVLIRDRKQNMQFLSSYFDSKFWE
jgi:hypothetical protein